jgi:predicted dehydrogenase
MDAIKLGMLGGFARLLPSVQGISAGARFWLTERRPDRLEYEVQVGGVTETYASCDELLRSDCDAVAILTPTTSKPPGRVHAESSSLPGSEQCH